MKVLRILSDVRLVIAELEVHLGEDVRNSPTLCAVVPGVIGAPDQVGWAIKRSCSAATVGIYAPSVGV